MTKDPVLLPEESVICGCKQEKGAVLLTSDGWLAEEVPVRFEGITRLHRLLHLSKIESRPTVEVQKENGISRLALIISLIISIIIMVTTIHGNIERIWEGDPEFYICDSGQEIPFGDYLREEISCADGSGELADDLYVLFWILPLIVAWVFAVLSIRTEGEQILSIVHENGTMDLRESTDSIVPSLWKFWWGTFVSYLFLFGFVASNGLKFLIDEYHYWIIGGLVLIIGYLLRTQEKSGVETDEIPYVGLGRFHEDLSTALGLSEGGSGNQEVRTLSDSMGGELEIIRKRLEEHEEILTQIVVHYDHIYSGSTHWMGTSAVRASTEILLAHRLRELLPNPSKETRTLANYRDQLKKHDSGMDSEVLRSIDVIVSLGNAAAHNMEATKQDYLSALQKFADVVEWHLSTPPKSIIGS